MHRQVIRKGLSKHNVQNHHQGEAEGKADSAYVGVLALGLIRDQFLYDHIEHSAGSESQHVRHNADD